MCFQSHKEIFVNNPAAIILTRPETDLRFLKLLRGKEHKLFRLATKDLELRPLLAPGTKAAVESLGDLNHRIQRVILLEILERCMFLLHWSVKHPKLSLDTSWDALVVKAVGIINDIAIDPRGLERFATTEEDLEALGERKPKTWVELAVLEVLGDGALVDVFLDKALAFHAKVSTQASAHLNLVGENTYRTQWLSAKLLQSEANLAKDAASELLKYLVTTTPANRTPFEKHFLDTPELWRNLEAFSTAEPAVLLWRDKGKYERLFKFIAPRFLLAPDHVLDAERVHARWQWTCLLKRGIRFQGLNASLRLMHFLEHHTMPSDEILIPCLQAEAVQHRLALAGLKEEDVVAPGWRFVCTCNWIHYHTTTTTITTTGGPPPPPTL